MVSRILLDMGMSRRTSLASLCSSFSLYHNKCKTLIGKGGGATVLQIWFVVLFSHRYSSARDEISPAHPLEHVLTSVSS